MPPPQLPQAISPSPSPSFQIDNRRLKASTPQTTEKAKFPGGIFLLKIVL
jgi:hypothetical protein